MNANGDFTGSAYLLLRVNLELTHSAGLGVMQDVAMEDVRAGRAGVAEIEAESHGGVGAFAFPGGNRHGVAHFGIEERLAIGGQEQEMDAVHAKGVILAGAVGDDPVFDRAYLGDDGGGGGGLEGPGRLTFDSQEVARGADGAVVGFGEV